MKAVAYHPAALKELVLAAQYYESASAGLGHRFIDEIERGVAGIAGSPEQWPFYVLNSRKRVLDHFPYLLVYLVQPDRIYILAVMHQKRRPGYWKERLKGEGSSV